MMMAGGGAYNDFWTPPVSGYVHLWDMSDQAEITESSGTVSNVGDKGSAAIDLTQATSFLRPSGWDSSPLDTAPHYRFEGVVFDGDATQGDMLSTASTTTLSSEFTLIIALTYNPAGAAADVIVEHSANWIASPYTGFILYFDNATNDVVFAQSRSISLLSAVQFPTDISSAGCVLAIKSDATHAGQRLWRDGAEITGSTLAYSADVGTSDATQSLHLGRRVGDSSIAAPMVFGTMAIWDSELTDGDMVTLSDSLASHWGI
jgi:hypothetical protein